MITDDMVATWKMNYGLDTRGPAEAMKWWVDAMDGKAPAGAVAALGLLLEERERCADAMRCALELIAAPMRPDGTWNRDREACRQLAAEALRRPCPAC